MATDSSTITKKPLDPDLFKEVTGQSWEAVHDEYFPKHNGDPIASIIPTEEGSRVDLSPNENLTVPVPGIQLAHRWAKENAFRTEKSPEAVRLLLSFLCDPDVNRIDDVAEQMAAEGVENATAELEWWANTVRHYATGNVTVPQLKAEERAARKYEGQAAPSASPGVCAHTGVELPPEAKMGTRRGKKGRMRKYDYRTGDAHDIVVEAYHDGQIYLTNLQTGITWYWEGEKRGDLWDEVFKAARRMANAIKAQQ